MRAPVIAVAVLLLGACPPQTRKPAAIAGGAGLGAGLIIAVGAAMGTEVGSCDDYRGECDSPSPKPGLVLAAVGLIVMLAAAASPAAPPPPVARNVVPPEDLPR